MTDYVFRGAFVPAAAHMSAALINIEHRTREEKLPQTRDRLSARLNLPPSLSWQLDYRPPRAVPACALFNIAVAFDKRFGLAALPPEYGPVAAYVALMTAARGRYEDGEG